MNRVLLVEDDEAVRAVLALVLERAGWQVESVSPPMSCSPTW